MAATAGKKALLKVATTVNGTYNTVKNIKSVSIEIDGANLDVSQLGDDWMTKIQGMKDAKITASGSYDLADTTGQVLIVTSQLTDAVLYAQVLVNGVNGFQCQVKITKVSGTATTSNEAQVAIDMEQTGGVTQI